MPLWLCFRRKGNLRCRTWRSEPVQTRDHPFPLSGPSNPPVTKPVINLRVSPGKALGLLEERIVAAGAISHGLDGPAYYDVVRWCSVTWQVIDEIYGTGDPRREEIRNIALGNCACSAGVQAQLLLETYISWLEKYGKEIRELT